MKEAYYFSHDSNATRDPKIIKLLSKYKWTGYGMFWALVEMLYEQNGRIHLEDNLDVFAYSLGISSEDANAFINFLINIELLSVDQDGYLFSKRLMKSLDRLSDMKEKKHLAGVKSAESRKQRTGNTSEQDSDSVQTQFEDDLAPVEQKQNNTSTVPEQNLNNRSTVPEQNINNGSTGVEHMLSSASTDFNKGKEMKGKEIKEKEIFNSSPPKSEISEEGKEYANFFKELLPPTQRFTDADLKNWGETFDKLIRIDKRPREEIYEITEWARKDSFWGEQGNFLSACKLRNKSKDGVFYYDVFLQKFKNKRVITNGTTYEEPAQLPSWAKQ